MPRIGISNPKTRWKILLPSTVQDTRSTFRRELSKLTGKLSTLGDAPARTLKSREQAGFPVNYGGQLLINALTENDPGLLRPAGNRQIQS